MPVLEAPAEYSEPSGESSLQQQVPGQFAPPGPAALAQMRPQDNQQQHLHHQQLARNNRRLLRRNNSYDRELDELEESQHFPAFVHLLPVNLPTQAPEPTLEELLRRVTQRTDLEHVEVVRLRVISYTISLSQLSVFLPRLQQLDLSGSVLSSLRDLGYGLAQVTHLNISNCGLNSFDGTSGLPAIRVLIADGNMIQRVGPLAELLQLQRLSARNNRISELGLLSFLGMCPMLAEVELQGNPVCRLPMYRATLRRSVPTLMRLDGQTLSVEEPTTESNETQGVDDDDDQQSSISSDAPNNNNINSNSNNNREQRIAATSTSSHRGNPRRQLSMPSTPVAGSVLGLVRQRRRPSGHAWVSSSSSSSSSASACSSAGSTRAPSVSSFSSHSSVETQSTAYSFSARSTFD